MLIKDNWTKHETLTVGRLPQHDFRVGHRKRFTGKILFFCSFILGLTFAYPVCKLKLFFHEPKLCFSNCCKLYLSKWVSDPQSKQNLEGIERYCLFIEFVLCTSFKEHQVEKFGSLFCGKNCCILHFNPLSRRFSAVFTFKPLNNFEFLRRLSRWEWSLDCACSALFRDKK